MLIDIKHFNSCKVVLLLAAPAAVLVGCFHFVFYRDDQHFFCSATNHGVLLTEAEEVFEMIRALKNNYVRQIVRQFNILFFLCIADEK